MNVKCKMVPAYANLFMGDMERKLLAQSPFNLSFGGGT